MNSSTASNCGTSLYHDAATGAPVAVASAGISAAPSSCAEDCRTGSCNPQHMMKTAVGSFYNCNVWMKGQPVCLYRLGTRHQTHQIILSHRPSPPPLIGDKAHPLLPPPQMLLSTRRAMPSTYSSSAAAATSPTEQQKKRTTETTYTKKEKRQGVQNDHTTGMHVRWHCSPMRCRR